MLREQDPLIRTAAAPTTTFLIRHAHTRANGVLLAGRTHGCSLSARGRNDAERLGRSLAEVQLTGVYASPLERVMQTAEAIACCQQLPVVPCDDLADIDFGAWTGKTFTELDADPAWRAFNRRRATAVIPGGERPADVQRRAVGILSRLAARHAGGRLAIVSHGDVLRYALLHFARMPLDCYDAFEIDPASVTAVVWLPIGPRVLYVNNLRFAGIR